MMSEAQKQLAHTLHLCKHGLSTRISNKIATFLSDKWLNSKYAEIQFQLLGNTNCIHNTGDEFFKYHDCSLREVTRSERHRKSNQRQMKYIRKLNVS